MYISTFEYGGVQYHYCGDSVKWVIESTLSHMKQAVHRGRVQDIFSYVYNEGNLFITLNVDSDCVSYNVHGKVIVNGRSGEKYGRF